MNAPDELFHASHLVLISFLIRVLTILIHFFLSRCLQGSHWPGLVHSRKHRLLGIIVLVCALFNSRNILHGHEFHVRKEVTIPVLGL